MFRAAITALAVSWLFKDGQHIGTIPKDSLPFLILKAVEALKNAT